MKVNVAVDSRRLFDRFGPKADRRFGYAVETALNKTATKWVQPAIRDRVQGAFTVRQKSFISRNVAKIERRSFASARAGRAFIEIAMAKVPRFYMALFEEGESIPPWVEEFARGFVPLPVIGGPARRSRGKRVPSRLKLSRMTFAHAPTRSGGFTVASSVPDLYLVPGVGIFQRKDGQGRTEGGSGRGTLVYYFFPKMSADTRLEYVKTGARAAREHFGDEMAAALAEAIRFDEARRAGR